ncbi:PH domain-containing protein [Candidatus Saccharibacteria bacterium]|nr:PH domain-containing protein [Candidatus Saccharibacteria bacterium]
MQPGNPKQSEAPSIPPPLKGVSSSKHEDLLEEGECILTVVHRSLVGLLAIYLVAIAAVLAFLGLMIAISPSSFETSDSNISASLSAVIFMSGLLLALILFTATYVYRQSRLLITDKSLIQIMQKTLFSRKISRLSMSNVEDVNEEQRGFWSSFFNYGTLTVQTAGAKENFIFSMCPSPAKLADRIIEARQAYAKSVQEENERPQA